MDKLFVVKIGGEIIDDELRLNQFLKNFSVIKEKKILVHGGGVVANNLLSDLGVKENFHNGRRITDVETLKVVTMVYAGLINKKIVASLQSKNINAIGLTGADAKIISAKKRINNEVDFGFVGDISSINSSQIENFLQNGLTPILAPITSDSTGQLLNTNADTIAGEIAIAMSKNYSVELIYSFGKKGVLQNIEDENSVLKSLNFENFNLLKNENKIFSGMLPKLENCFNAIKNGVSKVIIGDATELDLLILQKAGTEIVA